MTSIFFTRAILLSFAVFQPDINKDDHQNHQKDAEWEWLFDGKNTDAWKSVRSDKFPEKGWKIVGNELVVNGDENSGRGGDIITLNSYSSFDLQFDFKLSKGANGGLKYFVRIYPSGSVLGCEYQLIDDENNKDIKKDEDGKRLTAGLYELFEAKNKKMNPYGQWNTVRILVDGKHVEHWLNGIKVLEYERGSEAFMKAKAKSKFKDVEDFGTMESGHILLQDHGDRLAYRNIKIKEL
ncbi:MAG: DUF1080 domain-containing protein [Cyclobacteriaceae bacterium]|nr:DUF1080 domain-containing protein [Cyclobacteriaceae bacterium]